MTSGASTVFMNDQGRMRAVWRILLFLVAMAVVNAIGFSIAHYAFGIGGTGFFRDQVISAWISLAATLVVHWLMVRAIEHREWSFVSLHRGALTPGKLAIGALIGALAIGVPSAVLVGVHWLRVTPEAAGNWWYAAGRVSLLLIPAAMVEELMMRGYLFAVLREGAGTRVAVISTSVIFGLLHLGNLQGQHADPLVAAEAIGLVMIAGVLLAGVLLVTRSLYAAFATHFAWNWMLAAVLHSAVSGLPFAMPGYTTVDAGPDWATGGFWGPEGGAGAALGMGAGLVYLWSRRRASRATDTDIT